MKTLVILEGYAELKPIGKFDEELKLMPKYRNSVTGEEGSLVDISDRDRVWWPTPWIGSDVITFRQKAGQPVKQGVKKKRSLRYPILVEMSK